MARHIQLGNQGEEFAAQHLIQQGWTILARNWRPHINQKLELDIIAKQGQTLVFVEVKTRTATKSKHYSIPAYTAFTTKKQQHLIQAATMYLNTFNLWHIPCRFDLICLTVNQNTCTEVEIFTHVIELGHSLDSRNTSWQPW